MSSAIGPRDMGRAQLMVPSFHNTGFIPFKELSFMLRRYFTIFVESKYYFPNETIALFLIFLAGKIKESQPTSLFY